MPKFTVANNNITRLLIHVCQSPSCYLNSLGQVIFEIVSKLFPFSQHSWLKLGILSFNFLLVMNRKSSSVLYFLPAQTILINAFTHLERMCMAQNWATIKLLEEYKIQWFLLQRLWKCIIQDNYTNREWYQGIMGHKTELEPWWLGQFMYCHTVLFNNIDMPVKYKQGKAKEHSWTVF